VPTYLETLAQRHAVAEKTELALLQREERQLQALTRQAEFTQLLEHSDRWASADPHTSHGASVAGLGSAANDLYHPGAIGAHSARPGSRRHGAQPPFYRTEQEHWQIVDAARVLEAFCPAAVTVLEVLADFCIFPGYEYKAVPVKKPGKEPSGSNPQVDKAQEIIDKWHRAVDWPGWELELFKRTERDGETLTILEPDDESGLLGLRSAEPEQIKEPTDGVLGKLRVRVPDHQTFRFGILTEKADTSKPLAYSVVSQYNDTQRLNEIIEADDMFHIKIGVDRQAKRGVSSFFANINDFPGVKKLLRALRESATVQANIAWVKEFATGVMPSAIGDDLITTRAGDSGLGIHYDQPHCVGVPQGTTYTAGPLGLQGQNSALILVLQAALRNIGARWRMPEGLVSGDASNNNYASALVAEAPFVRAMGRQQAFYRNKFRELHERVLEAAMGEGILDEVEVSIEMPPVVPRDAKEETERNLSLNEGGHLSNQTLAAREDLDFDDEQAMIEESPIEPPSIMLGMEQPGEPEGETQNDTQSEGGVSDTPGVKQPKKPRTPKASATSSPEDN